MYAVLSIMYVIAPLSAGLITMFLLVFRLLSACLIVDERLGLVSLVYTYPFRVLYFFSIWAVLVSILLNYSVGAF